MIQFISFILMCILFILIAISFTIAAPFLFVVFFIIIVLFSNPLVLLLLIATILIIRRNSLEKDICTQAIMNSLNFKTDQIILAINQELNTYNLVVNIPSQQVYYAIVNYKFENQTILNNTYYKLICFNVKGYKNNTIIFQYNKNYYLDLYLSKYQSISNIDEFTQWCFNDILKEFTTYHDKYNNN